MGDVRVVEGGQELGLALEAGEALGILRQLCREDLDRDLAAELRVSGAVHLAHPSGAEGGDDLVGAELHPGGQSHCDAPRNVAIQMSPPVAVSGPMKSPPTASHTGNSQPDARERSASTSADGSVDPVEGERRPIRMKSS